MSSNPFISVIMNCYNSDTYLKEAIESLLNQSYRNFELIFWDNQSSDKSAEIIHSYKDDRVRYFYAPKHTDLGKARNLAIEKVTSQWIAFLDADDLWEKEKLALVVEKISHSVKSDKIGVIYTKSLVIDSDKKLLYKLDKSLSGNIYQELLESGNFIVQSSMVVSREAFENVNGIDEALKFCTDYDLVLKITQSYNAVGINRYLTSYRVHGDNFTDKRLYTNHLEVVELLRGYYKKKIPFALKIKIFLNNSYRLSTLFFKLIFKNEWKNMWKLVVNYTHYLLLAPVSIFYIKLGKKDS